MNKEIIATTAADLLRMIERDRARALAQGDHLTARRLAVTMQRLRSIREIYLTAEQLAARSRAADPIARKTGFLPGLN